MNYTKDGGCPCHDQHARIHWCECDCHKGIGLEGYFGEKSGGRLMLCYADGCSSPAWNPPYGYCCLTHTHEYGWIGKKTMHGPVPMPCGNGDGI